VVQGKAVLLKGEKSFFTRMTQMTRIKTSLFRSVWVAFLAGIKGKISKNGFSILSV
jgi:hypothetical protein